MHRVVTILAAAPLVLSSMPAFGCLVCNSDSGVALRASVFGALPVALVAVAAPSAILVASLQAYRAAGSRRRGSARPNALVSSGVLLGAGMGGSADGIVLHQILQLHAMLSARVPKTTTADVELNMFWDGIFQAGTWTLTAIGVWMLFRVARRTDVPWSSRVFGGALCVGWGAFNLIEGVIDHHILGLHHVVESAGVSVWDWAFLISGGVLIAVGGLAIGAGLRAPPPADPR